MNIKVKDLTPKAEPVVVYRAFNASKELIRELALKEVVLDYHYGVCDTAGDYSDIFSESLVEYLSGYLMERFDELGSWNKPKFFEKLAKDILNQIEDEVVEEIITRDENACDWATARAEGMRGDY